MTNEQEQAFLVVAKQYEELKDQLTVKSDELQELLRGLNLGEYVQDPETGLVYKIVKPTGRFVYYNDREYIRTAKADERAGSLSKKEAEEAGFTLPKKA